MKKLLSIMLIMLGIGMVLAVGVYYYPYYTRIQVHGIINHQKIPKPLAILGDLNPTLNCDTGKDCTTDWINISNPTIDNQTIKIKMSINGEAIERVSLINVNRSFGNIGLINITCYFETLCYGDDFNSSASFVIAPDSESGDNYPWNGFAFRVIYHLKEDTGSNYIGISDIFNANITITSNMTQY